MLKTNHGDEVTITLSYRKQNNHQNALRKHDNQEYDRMNNKDEQKVDVTSPQTFNTHAL
jgi:hypothetical protein